MEKYKLLNTYVNNLDMHETISEIENLIVQKKKSYIVAVNVDVIIKIESDLNKNYLPLITKNLINKFSSNVSIKSEGLTTYFSLFLPLQGVL